jgi:hypothetical protein
MQYTKKHGAHCGKHRRRSGLEPTAGDLCRRRVNYVPDLAGIISQNWFTNTLS